MKQEAKDKALKQRNRDFFVYFCSGKSLRETAVQYGVTTVAVQTGINRLLRTANNQMTKAEKNNLGPGGYSFDSYEKIKAYKEVLLKAYDREDDSHLIGKLTLQNTVDEFIFTTRAGNTLRWFYDGDSLSKVTIERLAKDFTENTSEFRKMPNLGKVCFDEIKNALIRHGFIEENIASLVYSLKAEEANMFTKPPLSPAVVLTFYEMSLVKMLKEVVALLKEGKYVFLVSGYNEQVIVKNMLGNNQLYPYLQYLSVVHIDKALEHLNFGLGVMNVKCLGNNDTVTVITKTSLHNEYLKDYLGHLFEDNKDYVLTHHRK